MCFGGGKSSPPPQPAPAQPGIINVDKVAPDPSQAYRYRGEPVGENVSGRQGGGLLLDSAAEAATKKATLGG